MAMTTRCFMPPENWWGYSFLREAGIPTISRTSPTRWSIRSCAGFRSVLWYKIASAI